VVFIFIINVRRSRTELLYCIPLGALRCSGACVVLIFSFPGCPWLPLAVPGCSWPARGCSWLLLAAPRPFLGCSWLLLAASGCSWLSLAVVNVNSRSKGNNFLGVLRCDHIFTIADSTNVGNGIDITCTTRPTSNTKTTNITKSIDITRNLLMLLVLLVQPALLALLEYQSYF
jgi:hypothetical protein